MFDPDHNQLYNPDTGQPLTGIINRSATQNYLEVPLLISYYLRTAPSSYIIVSAGPYLAYGLSGKQKTKGDTQQSGSQRYYYEQKPSTSQAPTVSTAACKPTSVTSSPHQSA